MARRMENQGGGVYEAEKKKGVKDESSGYQTKVITYIAAFLSLEENVENYDIYTELQGIPLFDDLIVKIWFKNNLEPYCYLSQIKHKTKGINFYNEKHKLKDYMDAIKKITDEKNKIKFLQDVPVNNIHYWFYSTNYVHKDYLKKNNYHLIPHQNCTSLLHLPRHEMCHKLICEDDNERRNLENLHFILNQPDTHKIEDQIKKLNDKFTNAMTKDLIKYIDKFYDGHKIRALTKTIYETELLRIHLSNIIVRPVKALDINDNQARIWNEICLRHEFTITEAIKDIETCIFGCFLYKINALYDCNLDWNRYVIRSENFDENVDAEMLKQNWQSKNKTHWNSMPDSLETLIIEMWKVGDLPLLLKTRGDVSVLNKYRHLKKHFIVIGDVKEIYCQLKQFKDTSLLPIKIFSDVATIHTNELRDELLKEITVSLQGRKPTSLYSIIDGDHGAMKELPCDQILQLIRKRSLFLQKEVFDKTERVIYIIVTEKIETGYDFDFEKVDYEINEKIKCKDFEVKALEERIKAHSILQYYKQCRVRLHDDKYEPLIHDQVDEFMKNFAVDQNGESIYGLGEYKLAPVIGGRLKRSDASYIKRYLSMTSLPESYLEEQGGRVIFLWGDLNSLSQNNRDRVINKYNEYKIEQKLNSNQAVLFDANEFTFEQCQSKYSFKKCIYLRLKDGYLKLIDNTKYRYFQKYILSFEEGKLFEQNIDKMIISGEPGIGKSSLLKSLAENYNESNYVLFCNLSDYRSELQNQNAQLLNYPLEFIFNKIEKSVYKAFLQKIFNLHRENGKMILFLDSFDEILPYYKKQVLSILDEISKLNVKFVISSRSHADNILVEKLKTEPIKIENLNRNKVEKFLQEEKLFKINLESISSEFLENPLYLQFLILLYQEDPSMFIEIDQFDLYERFIYKKVERYRKKYKKDYNPNYLKHFIDKTLKYHRLMALRALFDKKILGNDDLFKEYINLNDVEKENKCKVGFIKHFDEHNFPVFSHQTFAEFLAAQWIIENLFKQPFAKELYTQTIKDVNYHLSKLYNNIICKDLKLHTAVLKKDIRLVHQLCTESDVNLEETDKIGRTALHLVSDHIDYKIANEKIIDDYKIIDIIIGHMTNKRVSFSKKDLILECNWIEYRYYFDQKIRKQDSFLSDELKFALENDLQNYAEYLLDIEKVRPSFSSLKEAAQSSSIDVLKKLIAHSVDITKKDEKNNTILHYAAKNPQRDVIRYVLNNTVNINQRNLESGRTPLHVACEYGNVFAVSELLEKGANPNVLDIDNNNPLHYMMSSYYGSSEARMSIISSLVKYNIDLKQINSKGNTLLHYACKYNTEELFYYLLDKLPDESIYITNHEGHTPFDEACMRENVEIVKHLLNKYPNVTISADTKGNTCFHLAAKSQSKSVISILVEEMVIGKATLEIRNNKDETPLHISVQHNSYDVTEFLLERGHDPNVFDENGKTPLYWAVQKSISLIELLLKKGAEVNWLDKNLQSPLHAAVLSYQSSADKTWAIKLLLSKNAKMHLKDIQGYTPLHLAIMKPKNEPIVDALLDRFADHAKLMDLIQKDMEGNTLLHYACQYNCARIVDLFKKIGTKYISVKTTGRHDIGIENKDGKTPFHLACINNHISLVNSLLRNHPEVVELDKNGNTCLHLTANIKSETVFFMLVKTKVFAIDKHLQTKNKCGETLLHKSVENNSLRITEFLLERGHDPNLFDENGNTPLHLVARKGNDSLIDLLLRGGALINCRNNVMQTPLHLAVQSKYPKSTIETLLNKGAVVNLKDKHGNTAIHLAIRLSAKSNVDFLIDNLSNPDESIDVTRTYNQGYTLLHYACEKGSEKAVEYLLKYLGKDAVRVKNLTGKTPLHLACEEGNTKIVECLLRHDPEITKLKRLDDKGNTFWHLIANSNVSLNFLKTFDISENYKMKNDFDQTPLHISVMSKFSSATKFLLERGLDPNLFDKGGNTPLHYIAHLTLEGSIDILLQNGANINARNNKLETPLHKAVKFHEFRSVKKLLKSKADVNAQDIDGNTPLHLEMKTDDTTAHNQNKVWDPNTSIWRILLEHGADTNITNKKWETVLDIAKSLDKRNFLLHIEEKIFKTISNKKRIQK